MLAACESNYRCSHQQHWCIDHLLTPPQVIIDEMSMVGRRALGQIDEMLKQAKGSDDWFGGLSISALLRLDLSVLV